MATRLSRFDPHLPQFRRRLAMWLFTTAVVFAVGACSDGTAEGPIDEDGGADIGSDFGSDFGSDLGTDSETDSGTEAGGSDSGSGDGVATDMGAEVDAEPGDGDASPGDGGLMPVTCAAGTWDHDGDAFTACVSWSNCAAGTHVVGAPSATADRICTGCASGSFVSTTNATSCTVWSTCAAGTFVSTAGSAIGDRQCTPCAEGTIASSPNQAACTPLNACLAGTEQTVAGTTTTPPTCVACEAGTHCAGGTTPKQACASGSWDHDANSATACAAWTACVTGQTVTSNGSATADRVCTDIDECATNHGGCSVFAACTNTPGTRTCACRVGYTGDGFTCRRTNLVANNDFVDSAGSWVVEGTCAGETQFVTDDAVHGRVLGLYLGGGTGCTTTKYWQAMALDVGATASVRVRADVKMMSSGNYTGPVNLRVYAGNTSPYNQTLVGNHVFSPGALSESNALASTTSLPLGTWYSWTSNDLKPLIPAGTQYLRVELWIQGSGVYGWARVDNVLVIANDASAPTVSATTTPATGHPPVNATLAGTCADGTSSCSGSWWDFGNGPKESATAGGGSTASGDAATFSFADPGTYTISYSAEDSDGAARSSLVTVQAVNLAPTVAIVATPPTGPAPLAVQFTATVGDDGAVPGYAWTFGDGTTSTATAPAKTYATPGTYNVSLTVTDDLGATATTSYVIVVTTGDGQVANGGFANGLASWVLEGSCKGETAVATDNATHGNALGLSLGGGGGCTPTKLWQVVPIDVDAASSVRIRADVKMMQASGYIGAVNLRVYAGNGSPFTQTLVANHVFSPGALSENHALAATTSLPVGAWYGFTSNDFKSLVPAGTRNLRIEWWVQGNGVYGWARIDNVKLVVGDAAMPVPSLVATPTSGHAPLSVAFTGNCSDADGSCVSSSWDFGDGAVDSSATGGGSGSTSATPTFVFATPRAYTVSFIAEDDKGAARTAFATITAQNQAPTVSVTATPASGAAPLSTLFGATVTDPDGDTVSYAWSFGDGTTSTLANPTKGYSNPGTYNASLTVTDPFGATGSVSTIVVVTGTSKITNGSFASSLAGWVVDGSCKSETQMITDDANHAQTLGLYLGGGTSCTPTKVWQVAPVDVAAQTSVRVRADVKMMKYFSYTGNVNLRVFAGATPNATTLVGNHVFSVGALSENGALAGTTSLPLGTWYAYTSDDLKPSIPAGTQHLRVELWVQGGGVYGWARIDNVKVVLDDAAAPVVAFTATPNSGSAPLTTSFTGTCTDVDGCGTGSWDLGDGTTDYLTAGGGTSASGATTSNTFTGNRTYNVSYTVEDAKGAARTFMASVSTVNAPPSAAISATPSAGQAPLVVQFTANAADSDGTIASYAWSFGDGTTSTAANPSNTYNTQGTYNVSLTVTDNQGAIATSTYAIIVSP